jgi:hypothetical protein
LQSLLLHYYFTALCYHYILLYLKHHNESFQQTAASIVLALNKMAKKRNHSDSESSSSLNEEDEVMNGDSDSNDEERKEAENEAEDKDHKKTIPTRASIKKKEMALRSGKRKRRRSLETTGLTPPPTSRKAKRAKRSATTTTNTATGTESTDAVDAPMHHNREKKASSLAFGDSLDGKASVEGDNADDNSKSSPGMVPDPRRISYSAAPSLNAPYNVRDEEDESSSSDEDESEELDLVPPKHVPHANGTTQNDSTAITEQSPRQNNESIAMGSLTAQNKAGEESDQLMNGGDETLGKISNDTSSTSTSTWASTLQRLAIFVVLGYISLLFSMPQVIKFTQSVVPLDDSILPPLTIATPNKILPEKETVQTVHSPESLQSWNKKFLEDFDKFNEANTDYTSSKQALDNYYDELLGRFEKIETQLQPRQDRIEEKLMNLNLLEELLKEVDSKQNDDLEKEGNSKWDQARDLAQQLLGKSLLTTSSIALWNVPEDIDVDCGLGLEDNDNVDSLVKEGEEKAKPILSAQLLEEKQSALKLRSTITAEKYVGGPVAEDRIRQWVRSRISETVDKEKGVIEIIKNVEITAQELAKYATKSVKKANGDSPDNSNLLLSRMIESRFDVHRADTTGIYDHASLKNGAGIIYGGKRGTSKSLIDELPIFNRVLQNSNLRFYGFGPESALTATYPPNTLGQCWSFRQTPLKEQLKERQLFENDDSVPNDFKRGNFGTLTIRLSEPILVDSIIIEHPPIRMTSQGESAIRSFRAVGYEDESASSKAWNLGSYEYNLGENRNSNGYLQRFEAATTVFGKEIPPLHSISLAVDSNYGHDYACLYRFRVHGTEE